jgi:hypothetical protein
VPNVDHLPVHSYDYTYALYNKCGASARVSIYIVKHLPSPSLFLVISSGAEIYDVKFNLLNILERMQAPAEQFLDMVQSTTA